MKENKNIFKVLSDENRLRILKMLQVKPLCVCEITDILSLAPSTVSQHLRILKNEGFIIELKEGKWVNYLINPRPADERIASLLNSLDFWVEDSKKIKSDREKVNTVDRRILCGI